MRLSELFAAGQGAPIEVDGRLVQMMYELAPIAEPSALQIELDTSSPRVQGLRLKARSGSIQVNDQILDDVVLWSDTAPPVTVARLIPASSQQPLALRAWNVWRDATGTMQAWIGDAAMCVDIESDGVIILHCSDGFDKPTFDDLTVTLTLT